MYGDRNQLRSVFFRAWAQFRRGEPVSGPEQQVVEVARRHPEYHPVLEQPERFQDRDWQPEFGDTNPFLHMGLHIALAEQIALDRPAGIRGHYQRLCLRTGDPHAAEHQMIECLAEALWQAERAGGPPDEAVFLECVARLGP